MWVRGDKFAEEEEQEEEREVDGAGVAQGRRRRGLAAASSGEDEDGGDGGSFDFSAGSEDDEAAELEREYAAMRAEEQAAVEGAPRAHYPQGPFPLCLHPDRDRGAVGDEDTLFLQMSDSDISKPTVFTDGCLWQYV
jgi:hypothetical protein